MRMACAQHAWQLLPGNFDYRHVEGWIPLWQTVIFCGWMRCLVQVCTVLLAGLWDIQKHKSRPSTEIRNTVMLKAQEASNELACTRMACVNSWHLLAGCCTLDNKHREHRYLAADFLRGSPLYCWANRQQRSGVWQN